MFAYTVGIAGIIGVGVTIKTIYENKERYDLARQGGIIATDRGVKGKFFKKEYNQDYFKIMDNYDTYFRFTNKLNKDKTYFKISNDKDKNNTYFSFTNYMDKDKSGFCYGTRGYHTTFKRSPIDMEDIMKKYDSNKHHILKLNIKDDTEIFIEANGVLNVKDPSFVILDQIKTSDDFRKVLDENPYKEIPRLPYCNTIIGLVALPSDDWVQEMMDHFYCPLA